MINWKHALEQNWSDFRFGEVKVSSDGETHAFEVQACFGALDPDSVRLEIYANGLNGGEPVCQEMGRSRQLLGENAYIYTARVASNRPATDYTARVIPHFPGATVPGEASQILWQR